VYFTPLEVLQTVWNGESIFLRRLISSEVEMKKLNQKLLLFDRESEVTPTINTQILICSAVCTLIEVFMSDTYELIKNVFAFAMDLFMINLESKTRACFKELTIF
jgi:hypothetical protein